MEAGDPWKGFINSTGLWASLEAQQSKQIRGTHPSGSAVPRAQVSQLAQGPRVAEGGGGVEVSHSELRAPGGQGLDQKHSWKGQDNHIKQSWGWTRP